MLHPLAAWGQDVWALTGRGLHVGQTEGPQVLHALLHLQLITLPRWNKENKDFLADYIQVYFSTGVLVF